MANCKTCRYDDSADKRCETCGEGYMYYEPSPNYSNPITNRNEVIERADEMYRSALSRLPGTPCKFKSVAEFTADFHISEMERMGK